MIPQNYWVYNCSYSFFKEGRQLDLRESRSPIQFPPQSLQPVSHQFWAHVCTVDLELKLRMVRLMVMVMVLQVLSQVLLSRACFQVGFQAGFKVGF